MNSIAPERGATTATLAIIAAIVVVVAGAGYYLLARPAAPAAETTPLSLATPLTATPAATTAPAAQEPSGAGSSPSYTGAVLAGTSAPLLDFNQADFTAAANSDKLIVLYFYANWCPTCREEFPKMQAAFNELETSNVVGFRVNFNDNETDADERALARQHGIAYQHTKVIVHHGQQALKSPETWEQDRYLREIAAFDHPHP